MNDYPSSHRLMFVPLLALLMAAMACAQDCMGITFSVSGYVVDATTGKPIADATIHVWNRGSFERPDFDLYATSSNQGYFQTESVFSYGCTVFQVEVSANAYATQVMTYTPPAGEGWNDESTQHHHGKTSTDGKLMYPLPERFEFWSDITFYGNAITPFASPLVTNRVHASPSRSTTSKSMPPCGWGLRTSPAVCPA
jgi:hypothetical protein